MVMQGASETPSPSLCYPAKIGRTCGNDHEKVTLLLRCYPTKPAALSLVVALYLLTLSGVLIA